jgi:hypothetical protein
MKRKSILLVVTLLCMASLMAAMAYTSAIVTNGASFIVSNTDDALLAIKAGNHAAAGYTTGSTANELVINWAKGKDGAEFGVQSGSVYTWEDLFNVKNNSEKTVEVSVYVPIDSAKPEPNIGSKVYLKTETSDNWISVASRHTGAYGTKVVFTLEPGASINIDSKIDTMQRTIAKGEKSFNIVVEAKEVAPVVTPTP